MKIQKKESQKGRVLAYIQSKSNRRIPVYEIVDYFVNLPKQKITQPIARLCQLRNDGYPIICEYDHNFIGLGKVRKSKRMYKTHENLDHISQDIVKEIISPEIKTSIRQKIKNFISM